MNWKELKEKIEKMSPEEQEQSVKVWGEDMALMDDVQLVQAEEDMYFGDDWDYCYPKSDCEPEDLENPDVKIVCQKGIHYLNI